jgi:hypothetical protein
MSTPPAALAEDAPVVSEIEPLESLAIPEAMAIAPLPAALSALPIVKVPLDEPAPLSMRTAPPVSEELAPAVSSSIPPAPVLLAPA